jgi:hypothetical protein
MQSRCNAANKTFCEEEVVKTKPAKVIPENILAWEFYTEADFAEMCRVGTWTTRAWEREGIGPPVTRIGRARWYRKSAVAKWLSDHEKPVRKVAVSA